MTPNQEDPKEMVGGCCVCSDENGWTENPLVYCDGQGCSVAVHQACYGIVTVPTGSWFCRKCESNERSSRVRCELCPAKDGALKRTDSGGWAHVVCALYIPEVRFGNVTTMEPIMLQLIPPERFNKMCYICDESSRGNSKSQMGACMQCNRLNCKNNFHVTCAQAHGLLCEEAGNYLDNVKYCGYCSYHYNKLLTTFSKRGSHVKTIPPYRPVPPEQNSSDEDKNNTSGAGCSYTVDNSNTKDHVINSELVNDSESKDSKHKKRSSKLSSVFETSKHSNRELKPAHTELSRASKPSTSSTLAEGSEEPSGDSNSKDSAVSPSVATSAVKSESKTVSEPKSIVSDSKLNGSSDLKHCLQSPSVLLETLPVSVTATTSSSPPVTTSASGVVSTETTVVVSSGTTSSAIQSSCSSSLPSNHNSSSTAVTVSESKTVSTIASISTHTKITNSLPLSTSSQEDKRVTTTFNNMDKEKQRKARRNGSKTAAAVAKEPEVVDAQMVVEEESPSKDHALIICEEKNLSIEPKLSKIKSSPEELKLNVQFTANVSTQLARNETYNAINSDHVSGEPTKRASSNNQDRGRRNNKRGSGNSGIASKRGRTLSRDHKTSRDSGASSPDSFTSEAVPVSKRARAKKSDIKEAIGSVITNGIGVNTLLLGNQINPSSAVAQKMTDTLSAEIEAHSIYKEEEKLVSNLIGPALPGKRETSTPGAVLNTSQPPPLPQSLEQLLERQWEQGSQFLMEQAQHFDIASLLSCLHQLRQENVRLEETVNSLVTRRDHLLAVNARLSVPLSSNPQSSSVSSSQLTSVTATAPSSSSSMVSITGALAIPTSAPPMVGGSHLIPSSISSSNRSHSHGRHPSGGTVHPTLQSIPSGRGTSPHDRKVPAPHHSGVPLENGLGEPEYRYRSPGSDHQHRQQSPMLPPGAQPSPTSMRQSPASVNFHSGSSPHTSVPPTLSPSGNSHPAMPHHGHPPIMVSSSHRGPPPPDHSRAELVRLSSSQPNPNYSVYQMVSPSAPHHSPVTMPQNPHSHPGQSHSQGPVMRREAMDTGRSSHSSLENR